MMITLGSLFDGIGVFPLAASRHGITPVWASEIIPDAISITKRHFPEMVHLGDITKLDGGKIPAVHVITFGSPCQNLSSIGPRDGLSVAKSSLFYQAIRIIEEMRDASGGLYPAIAVWENVIGAMLPFYGFKMRGAAANRNRQHFLRSFGKRTDVFPTILASEQTAFAYYYEDDPLGGCIRYPTEAESERLMGLPPDWTKYGADGAEIRSSSRYMALGNSIALPCAEYIMEGIAAALQK